MVRIIVANLNFFGPNFECGIFSGLTEWSVDERSSWQRVSQIL